jgi:hypothetical protein
MDRDRGATARSDHWTVAAGCRATSKKQHRAPGPPLHINYSSTAADQSQAKFCRHEMCWAFQRHPLHDGTWLTIFVPNSNLFNHILGKVKKVNHLVIKVKMFNHWLLRFEPLLFAKKKVWTTFSICISRLTQLVRKKEHVLPYGKYSLRKMKEKEWSNTSCTIMRECLYTYTKGFVRG